jgi:transposase
MNEVVSGSLDYCDNMSKKCETNCFNDKRTSRVAEANWAKVVKILRQFNSYASTDDEQNH